MRITEGQLRRIIRESLEDEFRERLLARKKYYDDLAAQPLPYREGDRIVIRDRPWTGKVNNIPAIIEPGIELKVLRIISTTSGEFAFTDPAVLQVPESVVRMMKLKHDTIPVEPGDTAIISGAQIRNVRRLVESPLRRMVRESSEESQQNRFTDKEHRLAARLVDRLNDAVYDIANARIKKDGHFLTRDEAEEYFQTLFRALPPGPFKSLEDLRAAHSEFTDILMRRAGGGHK